jgi:signal transduction histidine kinase
MTLRLRIILSLVLIAVVLLVPAILALYSLRELERIVENLRARDAVAAVALGRLQTALSEVERWQQVHSALGTAPAADRAEAGDIVETNLAQIGGELQRLERAGYTAVVALAHRRHEHLSRAIGEQQRLIETGAFAAADTQRERELNDVYEAFATALDSIGTGINRASEAQVGRAQRVATRAVTSTLVAVAAALIIALLIAGWLTASLLRPIQELRRGMAVVAGGDFEPEIAIPPDRPDELGELTRSFERMTEQLAELDRLKAEFISIASHELKTPLSVIRGYSSLLMDGIYGEMPGPQQKVIKSISDQTDRLTRLVQQLLDVSRFEAGGGRLDLRPIELASFLAELATSFEALALPSQIDFAVERAAGLPDTIAGDPDRLNEVLGNLLSNAFKFTPRGGRILLCARPHPEGIEIEVTDSGVGIPADKLPKIFEKFFQVDNEAQPRSVGSGLGLAISREIVEAHGGTIAAESEVGRGTTFRVRLPHEPPTATPA